MLFYCVAFLVLLASVTARPSEVLVGPDGSRIPITKADLLQLYMDIEVSSPKAERKVQVTVLQNAQNEYPGSDKALKLAVRQWAENIIAQYYAPEN